MWMSMGSSNFFTSEAKINGNQQFLKNIMEILRFFNVLKICPNLPGNFDNNLGKFEDLHL